MSRDQCTQMKAVGFRGWQTKTAEFKDLEKNNQAESVVKTIVRIGTTKSTAKKALWIERGAMQRSTWAHSHSL